MEEEEEGSDTGEEDENITGQEEEESTEKSDKTSPATSFEEPADDEDDSIKEIKITKGLGSTKTYTSSNRASRRSSRRSLDKRRSKSLQDLVSSSSSSYSFQVGKGRRRSKDVLPSSTNKANWKSRSELSNKLSSKQSKSNSSQITNNSKQTESRTMSSGSRFSQLTEISTEIMPKTTGIEDQSISQMHGNSSLSSTNVRGASSKKSRKSSTSRAGLPEASMLQSQHAIRSSRDITLHNASEVCPKGSNSIQASRDPLTSSKSAKKIPSGFSLKKKTSSMQACYMGEQYARSASGSFGQTTHLPGIFGIPKVRESESKTLGCWQLDSPVLSQLNNRNMNKETKGESATARNKTSATDSEAGRLKQGDSEEDRRRLLPAIWTSSIAVFDGTMGSKQEYVTNKKSISSLPPSAYPPPTCKPTSTTGLEAYIAYREKNKYK